LGNVDPLLAPAREMQHCGPFYTLSRFGWINHGSAISKNFPLVCTNLLGSSLSISRDHPHIFSIEYLTFLTVSDQYRKNRLPRPPQRSGLTHYVTGNQITEHIQIHSRRPDHYEARIYRWNKFLAKRDSPPTPKSGDIVTVIYEVRTVRINADWSSYINIRIDKDDMLCVRV